MDDLNGRYFSAEILFEKCTGRLYVSEKGFIYLNQDTISGSGTGYFGYKYAWFIGTVDAIDLNGVQNFKLLPSPDKYHELFELLLSERQTTWSEDGAYSVIPKHVVAKISEFMESIEQILPNKI